LHYKNCYSSLLLCIIFLILRHGQAKRSHHLGKIYNKGPTCLYNKEQKNLNCMAAPLWLFLSLHFSPKQVSPLLQYLHPSVLAPIGASTTIQHIKSRECNITYILRFMILPIKFKRFIMTNLHYHFIIIMISDNNLWQ
jgi:hypothetical protein